MRRQFVTESPERIVDSRLIYQGRIVRFRVDTVALPDGSTTIREIVGTPGAVVVVPLTDDRQVRMVRQYRSAIGQFLLELPAGTLEPGEAPEQAAPRELAEETGDRAARWERLSGFYTVPGICDEYLHLFLATGLTPGQSNREPDEFIEVVTLPLDEALAMVKRGEIRDAKTIIGLLMVADRAGR
jgi:ADP-ribose pyrophosphatase